MSISKYKVSSLLLISIAFHSFLFIDIWFYDKNTNTAKYWDYSICFDIYWHTSYF
jgi:hypothetical protein